MDNFEWQKQLRYYWDVELDNCVVKMSNSMYIYGYEYLGASPRLVITPLTVCTLNIFPGLNFYASTLTGVCLDIVIHDKILEKVNPWRATKPK